MSDALKTFIRDVLFPAVLEEAKGLLHGWFTLRDDLRTLEMLFDGQWTLYAYSYGDCNIPDVFTRVEPSTLPTMREWLETRRYATHWAIMPADVTPPQDAVDLDIRALHVTIGWSFDNGSVSYIGDALKRLTLAA